MASLPSPNPDPIRRHDVVNREDLVRQPLLHVSGHRLGARSFDAADLGRFAQQTLGPMDITCMAGRPMTRVEGYVGLKLIDLLDSMGFSMWPRAELKRCAIVGHAHDHYQALFSWNELYNSPLGAGVLVLHERGGTPLDEHMGALCLISVNDDLIGPRHLRQLSSIEIRLL